MTDEIPVDWFFTFGPDHKHPVNGLPLDQYYIRLHGTCDGTRALMFAILGNRWAFQYPASDYQRAIARWGLTEIPVTEVRS